MSAMALRSRDGSVTGVLPTAAATAPTAAPADAGGSRTVPPSRSCALLTLIAIGSALASFGFETLLGALSEGLAWATQSQATAGILLFATSMYLVLTLLGNPADHAAHTSTVGRGTSNTRQVEAWGTEWRRKWDGKGRRL